MSGDIARGDPLLAVLPEVFQVSAGLSPSLRAVLAVGDDMQAPVRAILDAIDTVVDPWRAPARLVSALSRWVDLDWLTLSGSDAVIAPSAGIPTARQRDLIASSAQLSDQRGTASGLVRFLVLATGVGGFTVTTGADPFSMTVGVPLAAADQIDLVRRIVSGIKPAHLTDEVVVST